MSQENKDKPPVPRRDPDKPNVPDWAKEINPALEDGSESTGGPESAAPPSESKPDAPAPGKAESAKPEPPKPAAAAKKPAPPAAAATKPAGTAPGKPAPPAPKPASASKKPVPKPKPKIERREFLSWLSLGWLAFSVASAAGLTAMGRFFFPNVLFEPPSKFKVGFPQDFADGQVDLRFKQKYRVWIIRDGSEIYALHAKCTHLGCTPSWLAAENKFKCPCHGSGFYKSGINFEGPAPRPLERVKISLSEDGQILLDKSVIYQQEKGQWSDPSSFLIV